MTLYFDPMTGAGISDLIQANTCAIMFEAPGSGTFEMPDIPAIAKAATDAGVPTILDGTWATPVFCQPLALGVDIVVASMSKYLTGHSDVMMGMIASSDAHAMRIRKTVMAVGDKTGGQEVFLALRGLRTLKMRMQQFDAAGREMAGWFADQPQVKRVLHPAFENCPGHENWKRDFTGASGLFGVVFHPCDDARIRAFVDGLHHFSIGESWGECAGSRWMIPRHRRGWQRGRVRFFWVVGTDDLDSVIDASPVDLGEVVLFTRADRSWRLTVPADGSLPKDGLLPAFVEWSPGPHPSTGQQDLGVRLDKVQHSHPEPAALIDILKALNVDHLADVSAGEAGLSFAPSPPCRTPSCLTRECQEIQ